MAVHPLHSISTGHEARSLVSGMGSERTSGKWLRPLVKRPVVRLCLLVWVVAIAVHLAIILSAPDEILHKSYLVAGNAKGSQLSESMKQNPTLLQSMKNQLWIMFGILVICLSVIMYLLVTRLVLPIITIEQSAKELAEGKLDIVLPSHPQNELTELGKTLNSVAANYQEVLLLMGTAVGHACGRVEKIEQFLEDHGSEQHRDVRNEILALRGDLEMLSGVLRDFRFYQARFDGKKVVPHVPDT